MVPSESAAEMATLNHAEEPESTRSTDSNKGKNIVDRNKDISTIYVLYILVRFQFMWSLVLLGMVKCWISCLIWNLDVSLRLLLNAF